ncbi:hypothetical protein EMIHUDRAFT_449074 [Emiliania huxleyi CCMP1516]|uniref:Uncharacterized protein n=2 Tax=Emiliania huxleyi TaxID=2903 RepID=A0A0D3KLT7_EMIH1|nr:hypothetical protein EMIHUDRAFT_449074 [Emiliania huxleyi CCMP1516]EOD36722.1 hypothetical protein EMIHUDRAFT_449074 [Emiliania huxleyi CCMP1516]|eukprot:XP_005789151.1 hypothetical protein EMIHUDRAFT_449074 [Emiliania huxleyi CCMP1516]
MQSASLGFSVRFDEEEGGSTNGESASVNGDSAKGSTLTDDDMLYDASPPDDGGFGAFGDAEFDEFGGEWGGFDDVGTLAPAPEQLPAQLSGRSEPSGRSEGDGGEAVVSVEAGSTVVRFRVAGVADVAAALGGGRFSTAALTQFNRGTPVAVLEMRAAEPAGEAASDAAAGAPSAADDWGGGEWAAAGESEFSDFGDFGGEAAAGAGFGDFSAPEPAAEPQPHAERGASAEFGDFGDFDDFDGGSGELPTAAAAAVAGGGAASELAALECDLSDASSAVNLQSIRSLSEMSSAVSVGPATSDFTTSREHTSDGGSGSTNGETQPRGG